MLSIGIIFNSRMAVLHPKRKVVHGLLLMQVGQVVLVVAPLVLLVLVVVVILLLSHYVPDPPPAIHCMLLTLLLLLIPYLENQICVSICLAILHILIYLHYPAKVLCY